MAKLKRSIVYVALVLLALTCILPFVLMTINSTRSGLEIMTSFSFLPGKSLVDNWETVSTYFNLFQGFFNSLLIAVPATLLTAYFSAITAYALAVYHFKGGKVLLLIIVVFMMIPGQLSLIGFYNLISKLKLINSYIPLILPAIAAPGIVFFLRQYLLSVLSKSLLEAARIDGANEISDAVTSLGKLLRYGMKFSSQNVTIEQEIEYVKDYLDLINLRFDYRINLALNIPPHIYKQEIPKISMQPIVENAIYHGIDDLAEDASIYIKAHQEGTDFYIEITDSGKGMTEKEIEHIQKKIAGEIEAGGGSGNGIGLKNVQDRIRISFGEEYGISIFSKENCYTKVVVKLPIVYREDRKNE